MTCLSCILRVCQINTGKRKLSMSLLFGYVVENNIDICLIQEPNMSEIVLREIPAAFDYFSPSFSSPLKPRVLIIAKRLHKFIRVAAADSRDSITVQSYLGCSRLFRFTSLYLDGLEDDPSTEMRRLVFLSSGCRVHVIGADSNSWASSWGGHPCGRSSAAQWSRGDCLESFLLTSNYHLCNPESFVPTFENSRGEKSAIDITLCTDPRLILDWCVNNFNFNGDHYAITFGVRTDSSMQTPQLFHNVKKADWNLAGAEVKRLLCDISSISLTSSFDEIDKYINSLVEAMKSAVTTASPVSANKSGRIGVKWWNAEIDRAHKECKRLRRAYSRTRCPFVKNDLRRARKVFVGLCDNSKQVLLRSIIERDPMRILKVHDAYKSRSGLSTIDGVLENNAEYAVKNLLVQDSHSTASQYDTESDVRRFLQRHSQLPFTADISSLSNKIKSAVQKLNATGAPGIDSLTPVIIKNLLKYILPSLELIFSICLARSYFPAIWRRGKLVVIPKPDRDPATIKSLRPLTLLSSLSKVFEFVLSFAINDHINEAGVFPTDMHGFIPGRSCDSLLYDFTCFVEEEIRADRAVVSVQYDISKAFDALWHMALLHVMIQFEFPVWIILIISSYLCDRSVLCEIGGTSYVGCAKYGVPQGSVLGPIMYNIFNSLLFIKLSALDFSSFGCCKYKLLAYADDNTTIISASNPRAAVAVVEAVAAVILEWASFGKLKLSHDKITCIFFGFARHDAIPHPVIDGMSVPFVDSAKILGVIVDRRLSWHKHLSEKCESVRRILFKLSKVLKLSFGLKPKTLLKLYPIIITSRLFHGIVAWCPALNFKVLCSMLQKLHYTFCRSIAKMFRTASGPLSQCVVGLPDILEVARSAVLTKFLHGYFPPLSQICNQNFDKINPNYYIKKSIDVLGFPLSACYEKKDYKTVTCDDRFKLNIMERSDAVAFKPPEGSILVASDGSKLSNGSSGCGFVISYDGCLIRQGHFKLSRFVSVYDCEIYGILAASRELRQVLISSPALRGKSVIFFSDSKQALKSCAANFQSHPAAITLRDCLADIDATSFSFMWSPARSGCELQTMADKLARESHDTNIYMESVFSKHLTKSICKANESRSLVDLQGRISIFCGSVAKEFFPNSSSFRAVNFIVRFKSFGPELGTILSGHNCLGKYLHMIGVRTSPACACGHITEDVEHFLLHCPLFASTRSVIASKHNILFPSALAEFTRSAKMLNVLRDYVVASKRLIPA
jgi:hypothetical protein